MEERISRQLMRILLVLQHLYRWMGQVLRHRAQHRCLQVVSKLQGSPSIKQLEAYLLRPSQQVNPCMDTLR